MKFGLEHFDSIFNVKKCHQIYCSLVFHRTETKIIPFEIFWDQFCTISGVKVWGP